MIKVVTSLQHWSEKRKKRTNFPCHWKCENLENPEWKKRLHNPNTGSARTTSYIELCPKVNCLFKSRLEQALLKLWTFTTTPLSRLWGEVGGWGACLHISLFSAQIQTCCNRALQRSEREKVIKERGRENRREWEKRREWEAKTREL